jgi:uncharacterized protein
MFPLGGVLVPHGYLPLHVFEPRYRQLTRDCLAGDRRFGVVLIERGSEVGGGDVRTDLGTVARIVEAAELPDGRWFLACVGTGRIRVARWLPDDPYPQAEVDDLPEPPPSAADREGLAAVVPLLRRVLALANELGDPAAPATVELDPDPAVAAWQVVALAPAGPADIHRLLAVDDPGDRLRRLAALLADQAELLELRLTGR